MREIVTISVGKAASIVMSKYWRICAEEASIDPRTGFSRLKKPNDNRFTSAIFEEYHHQRYRPRHLFVDLSINTSDEIFASGTADFYTADQLIIGNEGAEYYSKATLAKHLPAVHVTLRKQAEACESLEGFVLGDSFSSHTISTSSAILASRRWALRSRRWCSSRSMPSWGRGLEESCTRR